MSTRSVVATVTLSLFTLVSAGEAQYSFPFPGPIAPGNWAVDLFGAPVLTPLGPGRPSGETIPSQLTIGPTPNGLFVSLQLTYNRVIVNPVWAPPWAVLAITPADPLAAGPLWPVPLLIFNPPMVVNVYPNLNDPNLITAWQPAVAANGVVTFPIDSLVPGGIPQILIGTGLACCVQGFFTFPQPAGTPWPTYATCGWRVQL